MAYTDLNCLDQDLVSGIGFDDINQRPEGLTWSIIANATTSSNANIKRNKSDIEAIKPSSWKKRRNTEWITWVYRGITQGY